MTYANHLEMHKAVDLAPLLKQRGLGVYEFAVLVVLARHVNHTRRDAWLSYAKIGGEALISRRQTIRAVKRLTEVGVLDVLPNTGAMGTNRYRILPFAEDAAGVQHALVVPAGHQGVDGATAHQTPGSVQLPLGASAVQTPPSARQTLASVQPARPSAHQTLTGVQLAHEIVTRVVTPIETRKVMGEETFPSSNYARGLGELPSSGFYFSDDEDQGLAGQYPATSTPSTPVPVPAEKQPPSFHPPGSAVSLSLAYLTCLGNPSNRVESSCKAWPKAFAVLLETCDADTIRKVMDWAWADKFWAGKLPRYKDDPVDYFISKFPTILQQWETASSRKVTPSACTAPPAAAGQQHRTLQSLTGLPERTAEDLAFFAQQEAEEAAAQAKEQRHAE